MPQSTSSNLFFDIAKVVQRYVHLEKLGPGYVGVCPFCSSATKGTLIVQPRFGTFTCNSCGTHGGIFQFLMTIKKCSMQEALEEVRDAFQLDFDSSWMDIRWAEILKGTDFGIICQKLAEGTRVDLRGTVEQPRIEVSYSMLFTYLQCPYRYKRRYIEHQQDEKTTFFLSLGRTLHASLSKFLKDVQAGKTEATDADTLLSILRQKWIPDGYADEEERQEWFSRAADMLINYTNSAENQKKPFAIEMSFKAPVGRFTIVGKIDRIDQLPDGTYEIIDYKVGGFDSLEKSQAKELQTAFYYLGATRGLGLNVSLISYYLLSQAIKDSLDYLPGDIFQQRIEGILDLITNDTEFQAQKNIFCQTCRFALDCQVYSGEISKGS